mgnify:CR=1 FL=1
MLNSRFRTRTYDIGAWPQARSARLGAWPQARSARLGAWPQAIWPQARSARLGAGYYPRLGDRVTPGRREGDRVTPKLRRFQDRQQAASAGCSACAKPACRCLRSSSRARSGHRRGCHLSRRSKGRACSRKRRRRFQRHSSHRAPHRRHHSA